MDVRVLQKAGDGVVRIVSQTEATASGLQWEWIDVLADEGDYDAVSDLTGSLGLDPIAVHDAIFDFDLPKLDDFGDHLHIVLQGLRSDRVAVCTVACFLTEDRVVTLHRQPSPALDAVHDALLARYGSVVDGPDDVLAVIADALTRRHLVVLSVFEDRVDGLVDLALAADDAVLPELMAIREDLSVVGHSARPQREALDQLRVSRSTLVSESAARRFSDVFDVAVRVTYEVDSARAALRDILAVYRGAESSEATDANRVLTLYAAFLFPLSLITAFWGMNFNSLPLVSKTWGWIVVVLLMAVVTALSLRVFTAKGWILVRSKGTTHQTSGRGLAEAAKRPVQLRPFPNNSRSDSSVTGEVPLAE